MLWLDLRRLCELPENKETNMGPPFVLLLFSPTAESFGVSAQIGSGVVRGGPEVRFHEGSTRVPPGGGPGWFGVRRGFHEGSTSVPLRGLRDGPGWIEVRFHELSPAFHQVLRGLRVRFHEGFTSVPPGSARAAGWSGVV